MFLQNFGCFQWFSALKPADGRVLVFDHFCFPVRWYPLEKSQGAHILKVFVTDHAQDQIRNFYVKSSKNVLVQHCKDENS